MIKIGKTDEGWAWVVLLSTSLTAFDIGIVCYSFGILNVAFLQRYEENVATTAVIGAVFLGALFLTAPVASMVINRFSCRVTQMVGAILAFIGFSSSFFVDSLVMFSLTYGIMAGAGMSLCYTVIHVVVCFHFKKYIGLAFGLTIASIGLGLLASGPVVQFLLDEYDLYGAFLLMGGIALNNVTFALFMFPTKAEISLKQERNKLEKDKTHNKNCNPCSVCQLDIFKVKEFVVVLISDFLYSLPYAMIVFHLPNLSVLSGSSMDRAALLNTALGTGSTINRLITGVAVGPEGVDPLLLYLGFNGILGLLSLTFPLYFETYTSQFIFCVIHGAYSGGVNAVRSPLYLQIVGLQYHSTAVGLMFFLEGIAFVIGPPLAGWIVDVTGSYEITFYVAGSCFIGAFLLALSSQIWKNVPIKQKIMKQNISTASKQFEPKEEKYIERRYSV